MSTDAPAAAEQAAATGGNGAAPPAKLIGKIAEAMAQTSAVTKDKRNTDQGYSYASIEAMLEEVRGPLHERGILLLPQVREHAEQEITSSRNTKGTRVTIAVDFTFLDGESGESYAITGWQGEGQDYGDKAYGKAYTNAIKTFVRAAWLLPAGDDPEASPSGDRVAKNGTPAWAAPAPKPIKAKAVEVLEDLIGDRQLAIGYAGTLADTIGHMPAVLAAWLAALPEWQEKARQASGEALKPPPEQVEEERRAAAEKAAQEASGEPEPEQVDPDEVQPPEDDGGALGEAQAEEDAGDEERPLAGVIEDTPEHRELWCDCPNPPEPGKPAQDTGDTKDDCPIKGHGIPF